MKKIIAISLVAILAVSSVFAAISGSVTTSAGFNLDTKEYGFFDVANENAKFVVDLYADTKDTTPVAVEATEETEAVEVPSVYAFVKASLGIKATIGKDKLTTEGGDINSSTSRKYYASDANGNLILNEDGEKQSKTKTTGNPYFDFLVEEAGVVGDNWSLSILGTPSAPAFAKSFLDLDDDGKLDDTYKVPYYGANGLEATIFGYKVGLGGNGIVNKGLSATAFVQTPDYDFGVEGLAVAGAATYSHRSAVHEADIAPGYGQYATIDSVTVDKDGNKTYTYDFDNWEIDEVKSAVDTHNISFSGKVGYATDLVSATVSTDLGVKNLKTTRTFGIDVAANVKYDFLAFDAYYGYKDRLDLQAAADLNKWAPVTLKLGVSNITNDSRNLYGEVGTTVAGFEGKLTGNVDLKKNPGWKVGVEASYNVEKIAKFAFSTSVDNDAYWGMSISAENTTLIPGATLALGWYDASDLLQKNHGEKFSNTAYLYDANGNPVTDPFETYGVEADHSDFGVIKASLKIEF